MTTQAASAVASRPTTGFSLRTLPVQPPLLLAPMADVTGYAFRELVRGYGGCGLFYSEMLNTRRVPSETEHSPIFQGFGSEPNLMLQLLGDDPDLLVRSIRRLEAFAPAGFDWNLGCARTKITRWGWGSELLKSPLKLARSLAAMRRSTERPVSVKMRVPAELTSAQLRVLVTLIASEGADALIVHPRSCEQGFSRPARWEQIAEIKSWLHIPVIGNGDILSVEDALAMFRETSCDGVMIGRAAVAKPYLFRDIAAALKGEAPLASPKASEVLERYLLHLPTTPEQPKRTRELKRFCEHFALGLPVPHWFWGPLQALQQGSELAARAREYFQRYPEQ